METLQLTAPEIDVTTKAIEEYIARLRAYLKSLNTVAYHERQRASLAIAETVLRKLVMRAEYDFSDSERGKHSQR